MHFFIDNGRETVYLMVTRENASDSELFLSHSPTVFSSPETAYEVMMFYKFDSWTDEIRDIIELVFEEQRSATSAGKGDLFAVFISFSETPICDLEPQKA
jgi:hypothetical protein